MRVLPEGAVTLVSRFQTDGKVGVQTHNNWRDWAWRKRVLQDGVAELSLEHTILSALVRAPPTALCSRSVGWQEVFQCQRFVYES